MSHRVTMKRWTCDNAQRHVTAFQPISEQFIVGHTTIWFNTCSCPVSTPVLPQCRAPDVCFTLPRSPAQSLLLLLVVSFHTVVVTEPRDWLGTTSPNDLFSVEKKGKVFPYSLPSVGPGADPGVQAVSEVNHAIDLAVGCHYFLPGLRLPP